MRRLLGVFVVVCVVALCQAPIRAESFDINALSNEEIIALLARVQDEIVTRHLEGTALLQMGKYVGGSDIPPASYVLSGAGTDGQSGIVLLRSVHDAEDDWPSKLYEFERAEDPYNIYITIEEGDMLALPYAHTLTISAGIVFK